MRAILRRPDSRHPDYEMELSEFRTADLAWVLAAESHLGTRWHMSDEDRQSLIRQIEKALRSTGDIRLLLEMACHLGVRLA